MQHDPEKVSSSGYILNTCKVLLKLCEPITASFNKMELIDVDFILGTMDKDETRINSNVDILPVEPKEGNFVSVIFLDTFKSLRYGILSLINQTDQIHKMVDELQNAIQHFGQQKNSGNWNPMSETMLKKYQEKLDSLISEKLAIECMLMDETIVDSVRRIYDFSALWLLRIMNGERMDVSLVARGHVGQYDLFIFSLKDKTFK
jgi:hypothetical protein